MSDTINDLIARLSERQQQEFALRCARRVQHLMRDPRSVAALDTRERWLAGSATDEEMAKAVAAARAAWWASEAEAAPRTSTRIAAWAAADAARAARDAASDAADAAGTAVAAARAARAAAMAIAREAAAWAAAFDAERAWQREELERMLRGGA